MAILQGWLVVATLCGQAAAPAAEAAQDDAAKAALDQFVAELRLMTQPLVRYEPKAGPVQDGAIFAFAIGTDPEALLLLESRKSGDSHRWEFAFARFHFVTITARHNGTQVWNVEADREMYNTVFGRGDPQREKIYYSVMKSVTMP